MVKICSKLGLQRGNLNEIKGKIQYYSSMRDYASRI